MPHKKIDTICVDPITGIKRNIRYDVRIASQQFANIASLLAGFSFTVIILIAQSGSSVISTNDMNLRSMAGIGFLVALFGCILAVFAFSLITAEECLLPRANHMALFAGSGFSITISTIFWSLSLVLKSFLVSDISNMVDCILPLFILTQPFFVVSSMLDNIYIFDLRIPKYREYALLLVPSISVILVSMILRFFGVFIPITGFEAKFNVVIWVIIITVMISSIISAVFSATNNEYRLSLFISGFWLGLISLINCIIVLST